MTKPLGHDLRNTPAEIAELLPYLTEDERSEIAELMARDAETYIWRPLPGPQYMAYMSQADDTGYGGAAGGGKLLKLSEPIATPDGFKRMGDLAVGDEVLDKDGNPCRVTGVSAIDPCPELWRFTFDDNTTIDSCVDHQWLVFNASELASLTRTDPEWRARRRAKRPSAAKGNKSEAFTKAIAARNSRLAEGGPPPLPAPRTTREIVASLRLASGRANYAVPVAAALALPEAALPVDPYVLGAWLGDGSKGSGGFTGIDPEICDEIERAGYAMTHSLIEDKVHYILGLVPHLREAGVLHRKHIPDAYSRASRDQRLALLQGLMDTDGTVSRNSGAAEFCNTNPAIAEGIQQLICSLGWKVSKREGRAKLNGKDCGPKWTLKFVADDYVFRLPRKRKLQKLATRRTTKFRYIVSAERIASEPGRCITVDSPSRTYLVGNTFLVTHNTDLMCGAALTQHHQSLLMRREYTQMKGIVQRMTEMLGGRDGYNGQDKIWRIPTTGRTVEFGSVPNLGDELNYQGRPRDLLGIDEATNFLRAQVVFLMGWVRTTKTGQRTRTINTFNPPTTVEGRWVIDHYGPWLDEDNLIPAAPGEIRWFAMIDGGEQEVENARQFVLVQGEQVFEFDHREHHPTKIIRPSSRTFIPSRISDNPFLVSTGYISTLQRMPEPLRSQMLYGDFKAGMQDDIWQVIPTAWVDQAMARWKPKARKGEMQALGVDVARGGKDKTLLSPRYEDWWFDELIEFPGKETPDGHAVAGQVVVHHRDNAPILIDVIGVGASPYDILSGKDQPVYGVDVRNTPTGTDKSGMMTFKNLRSQLIWGLREMLDPANNLEAALPPDPMLKKELCSVLWRYQNATCYVESREEIVARIGHSPDKLSALMLAAMDVPKVKKHQQQNVQQAIDARAKYDPFAR